MADIIDAQQQFSIELLVPVQEGFAEIVNISAPQQAQEGDTVNMIIDIRNNGGADTIFVSLESLETGFSPADREEAYIQSEQTTQFPFSFIMPSSDVNITVSAGHSED